MMWPKVEQSGDLEERLMLSLSPKRCLEFDDVDKIVWKEYFEAQRPILIRSSVAKQGSNKLHDRYGVQLFC